MMDAIQFIPHAKPMVFVDHLIEANDVFAIAELYIRPELMFCDADGLPTWASIELMAQTVSAYAGHKGQLQGAAPKVGFLLEPVRCNYLVLILLWVVQYVFV